MANSLLRSIVATIIGMVVAFALIWLAQYAGGELSPEVYDVETGEILIPAGATLALLIGWFIGSFAGGWLAMRASGNSGPGWVVAGAVGCAAVSAALSKILYKILITLLAIGIVFGIGMLLWAWL